MNRMPNHTDQTADRGGGAGYLYEWELGAEIAMVALLPDFTEDWRCMSTEVPIPVELREWLGSSREI